MDDKIVLFGMSCSGKTTFAEQMTDHIYYCFDALFRWELVETLGISIEANFQHIQKFCTADRFVLDGWHLADKAGRYLPNGAIPYVVYSSYDKIIDQYRVDVWDREQHRVMYRKWYEIDYQAMGAKYFLNQGEFVETNYEEFVNEIRRSIF